MPRVFWAAVLKFVLSFVAADAQTLDPEVRAAISEFADSICGVYNLEGSETDKELQGRAQASVDGFLDKLVDLGVEGSASFSEEKYTNVFREDIAAELKDVRTCRIEIWRDLKDTLVVVNRQETKVTRPAFNDTFSTSAPGKNAPRPFFARSQPSFNCGNAQSTNEKVLCVHDGAAEADRTMAQTYTQLRQGLNSADKKRLTNTQREWLAYREQNCTFGIPYENLSDVQIQQLGQCLVDVTYARANQLRQAF